MTVFRPPCSCSRNYKARFGTLKERSRTWKDRNLETSVRSLNSGTLLFPVHLLHVIARRPERSPRVSPWHASSKMDCLQLRGQHVAFLTVFPCLVRRSSQQSSGGLFGRAFAAVSGGSLIAGPVDLSIYFYDPLQRCRSARLYPAWHEACPCQRLIDPLDLEARCSGSASILLAKHARGVSQHRFANRGHHL